MSYIHSVIPRPDAAPIEPPVDDEPVVICVVDTLPEASAETMDKFYVIIDYDNMTATIWMTIDSGSTYNWYEFNKTGDTGQQGPPGPEGPRGPAGIETVNVTVDGLPGTPRAAVSLVDGALSISFYGLKGMQGDPGTSHARQAVVTTLPTAGPDTVDIVYLKQIGNTDEYERYITQFDGTNYSWLQIGTTEMTLDDYIRKDDIIYKTEEEMEEIEVFDNTKYYVTYEDEEI